MNTYQTKSAARTVLGVLVASMCILFGYSSSLSADTPTSSELTALQSLPDGYFIWSKTCWTSEGIYKGYLKDTAAVMINEEGGWASINPANPDIIAFAKPVTPGMTTESDHIWLMDARGGHKRKITSTPIGAVTHLCWNTGRTIAFAASASRIGGFMSDKLWILDTNGTVTQISLGFDASAGIDGFAAANDRIFLRNSNGCALYSWVPASPATSLSLINGSYSYCGPALSWDGTLGGYNNFNHDAFNLINARTGASTGAMGLSSTAGSNFHYLEWSNSSGWAIAATRVGKQVAYIVDMTNQRITRQTWNDPGVVFPSLYVGTMSATRVSAPQYSPGSMRFASPITVTLTSRTSGASIYYTQDGSEPTQSSTLYAGVITLSASDTIKARAYKSGMDSSDISIGIFIYQTYLDDFSIKINCGGATIGNFVADTCYGGETGKEWSTVVDTTGVLHAAPKAVYGSERYGTAFSYDFDNLKPGDTYSVRLHFAEIWFTPAHGYASGVGQRTFNVAINGAPVLTNYDIAADVGVLKAVTKEYTAVVPDSRILSVALSSGNNLPKISGIEIWKYVPPNPITILKPAAGSIVHRGDSLEVKWVYQTGAKMVFKLSTDAGASFGNSFFASSFVMTGDTGSIKWYIPASTALTTEATVEIYEYDHLDIVNTSELFTIASSSSIQSVNKPIGFLSGNIQGRIEVYRVDGRKIGSYAMSYDRFCQMAGSFPNGVYVALFKQNNRLQQKVWSVVR